jgi:hypothetical protein
MCKPNSLSHRHQLTTTSLYQNKHEKGVCINQFGPTQAKMRAWPKTVLGPLNPKNLGVYRARDKSRPSLLFPQSQV